MNATALAALPLTSAPELPGLGDLAALRRALGRNGARWIRASHTPGLLAHHSANEVANLDPSFRFRSRGDLRSLPARLRSALRSAGLHSAKTAEALGAEVAFLARTFAGLVEDPRPLIRLAVLGAGRADERTCEEPDHRPRRLLLCSLTRPEEVGTPLPLIRAAAVFAGSPAAWPAGELSPGEALLLAHDGRPEGAPVASPSSAVLRRLVLCLSSECVESPPSFPSIPADGADIVLVSMPFGPLLQPSLGLSLLAAALEGRHRTRSVYFTLPFARRIGVPHYEWITDGHPTASALLGEWLFRDALFPDRPADPSPYLEEVLLASTHRWQTDPGERPSFATLVPEGLVAMLLEMRRNLEPFVDACVDTVLAHRPRLVGLTSVFQQQVASLALARRLKESAPEVKVVFGGPNCEGVMGLELIRRIPWIDAVVSGEGDVVFPELVDRLIDGRPFDDLPGVYHGRSPEVLQSVPSPPSAPSPRHLDELPYPIFDDYFAQWRQAGIGRGHQPRLLFETSRGCWWGEKEHCTFCGLNGTNMAFRSKSAERALRELRALSRRHPGLFVGTADNILDMSYFRTFLPRLAAEKLHLKLFYEVKANLRKEQIRLLRAAGVVEIQPGVESLSDRVLALMKKGVTALQNIQLLKWCGEFGVWPLYNLIWGFPGEPEEAYTEMAELAALLHHLPPPAGMSRIFLERFSPNHARAEEMGFIDVHATPAYRHIYPFPPQSLDRLAYHFAYGYRVPRDVASYTRPLAEAVLAWREGHETSRLWAIDRGDHLLICDSRGVARQNLHVLGSLARALYLASDGVTSLDRLARRAAAEGHGELSRTAVEEALAPLLDAGLMLRRGERVLALALPHSFEERDSRGGETPSENRIARSTDLEGDEHG